MPPKDKGNDRRISKEGMRTLPVFSVDWMDKASRELNWDVSPIIPVLVIAARYHGLLMVVKANPVIGKKGLNIPAPYVNST